MTSLRKAVLAVAVVALVVGALYGIAIDPANSSVQSMLNYGLSKACPLFPHLQPFNNVNHGYGIFSDAGPYGLATAVLPNGTSNVYAATNILFGPQHEFTNAVILGLGNFDNGSVWAKIDHQKGFPQTRCIDDPPRYPVSIKAAGASP